MKKLINKSGKEVNINLAGLLNMMRFNADKYDQRQANAKKRAAFMGKAIRYDDCREDEDGHRMENAALSDCGRGAAVIYAFGELPLWRRRFDRAYDALDDKEKAVIDALFSDMRPAVAARIANTNRQRVYRIMAKFRELLLPAYFAWKMRGVL